MGRAYLNASTEADSLLYTTTRTPERESYFEWIGPIGPRKMLLFKLKERRDIQINSKEDLRKYRVGIVRDTSAMKLVVERGLFTKQQIDEAPSTTSNMKKLFSNASILSWPRVVVHATKSITFHTNKTISKPSTR